MDRQEFKEKCDPDKIREWLMRYIGHEHLGYDIKKVSLEKYLAVAPDVYVLAAMLQSVLSVAEEQRAMGEYGKDDALPFKPYSELTDEEKISQAPERRMYMEGLRRGRDMALIEMSNRIISAARGKLDEYRLENSAYDPAKVVDEPLQGELE